MNYFTALETYYKHLIDSLNEFELESIFKVSRFTSYCFFLSISSSILHFYPEVLICDNRSFVLFNKLLDFVFSVNFITILDGSEFSRGRKKAPDVAYRLRSVNWRVPGLWLVNWFDLVLFILRCPVLCFHQEDNLYCLFLVSIKNWFWLLHSKIVYLVMSNSTFGQFILCLLWLVIGHEWLVNVVKCLSPS